MNTKSIRANRGFSLPELITVVVVVAILGAIAIGVVSNLSTEAQRSAAEATAQSANRMLSNIRGAATGTLPAALTGAAGTGENAVIVALNTGVNVSTLTGTATVSATGPGTNEIRFIMNPPLPLPSDTATGTGNRIAWTGGATGSFATSGTGL